HHYGPGPWVDRGRRDWTSVYYHNAGPDGIGFNRTSSGSNAVGQYYPEVRRMFEDPGTCPENLLLWFHHLPWDYRMRSGRSLWEELCLKYHDGVDQVRQMKEDWKKTEGKIDAGRFEEVSSLLEKQERDAKIWRDGCLLYFREFSGKPFPEGLEKPEHDLDYYKQHRYNDIPGIR
ncbi:MAG: alpha-glucuronidase, partial [Bacteroidales bacterium]|nr:alpha-glucuronidase [Bacteroidales bacterium]